MIYIVFIDFILTLTLHSIVVHLVSVWAESTISIQIGFARFPVDMLAWQTWSPSSRRLWEFEWEPLSLEFKQ